MSHFGLPIKLNPAPSTIRKATKRIPRPSNCFIAYRMAVQHKILETRPKINSKEVSQIVGKMWKLEPDIVKNHFRIVAKQMKEEHASRYPDYNYNPKRRASLSETNNNLETKDPARQNFPQPKILPRRSVRHSVRQSSQIARHSQPAVHAKAVSGCKDSGYKKTEAGHHSVESSQCTFHSPDTHSDETAIMKQEIHHGQKWEDGITDYENLPGNPCFSFPMDEYEESNDNEVCELSTSTSSCSSQINTQEHLDCEYINFDDNGLDFGASLIPMSYSPKCWNEPSNDLLLPSTVNRIAPFTLDGLDGYWLPYNPSSLYTSSSDNFGYGSY